MTKTELIALITNIGFKLGYKDYTLSLYPPTGLAHQSLGISFIDENRFQLSQTLINGGMLSGKSFGIFDLQTFGVTNDIQLELFLSFINGAFLQETGSRNHKVTEYIRDNKIRDILK